jgi:hypothetical protein
LTTTLSVCREQNWKFLTVDPDVADTGQPYAYAEDDPVNGSDPSGLCVSLFNVVCVGGGSVTSTLSLRFDPGAGVNWFNEHLNPAYVALTGYYNEWQAAENGCGWWQNFSQNGTTAIIGAAGTIGYAGGIAGGLEASGYFTGNEFEIGGNFRISPFGNGNAEDPAARLPHYHWRQPDEFGNSPEGQGIGQHRPWQGGFFPW